VAGITIPETANAATDPMPSSKLSGRRSVAKKPGVCKTLLFAPIWPTKTCTAWVWFLYGTRPGPLINRVETHTLRNTPASPDQYDWWHPNPGPGTLVAIQLTAPLDPTKNYVDVSANDSFGNGHAVATWFPPGEPPPFNKTITTWATSSHPTQYVKLVLSP